MPAEVRRKLFGTQIKFEKKQDTRGAIPDEVLVWEKGMTKNTIHGC